ncbi:hypothetical protein MBLNU230_g7951t1 [Neophaeotheca triangularis]
MTSFHGLPQDVPNFYRTTADTTSSPFRKDTNPFRNRTKSFPAEHRENSNSNSNSMDATPLEPRRKSVAHAVRTRSLGGPNGGIIYERAEVIPPTDDDIVIVNVRLTDKLRRSSAGSFSDELIPRPAPRSFLRRISTRLGSPGAEDRYKAVKMPRSAYKAYFAKDKDGNYAGSEPERDWDEADLMQQFAEFQEMPLEGFVHATMCTNRKPLTGPGWTIQEP